MKSIALFTCLSLLCSNLVKAQYPYISHQDWVQWQSNPAYLGINKQENLIFDYNRSWISNEVNSNIGLLQYDRALVTSNNKNIGGIGISLLNNRVNYKELFNRFQASFGASYAIQLQEHIYLNFGLQGTYFADRVDNSGLITGSQYIPGWGFDANSGNNEPLSNLNTNYIGVSTGLFIYQESASALTDNYFGLSFKNFNQPINSFYAENSKLPMQINLMGGLLLLRGVRYKLLGELWYANSSANGNLTVGAVCQLENLISHRNRGENIHLRLLSRYSINNKIIVGGQLLYNGFAIGATYDIPANPSNERTYDSGFEVMLVLHRKAKPFRGRRAKNKKNIQEPLSAVSVITAPQPKNDTALHQALTMDISEELQEVDSSSQNSGNAQVGRLIEDEPLNGMVYFDFASREITDGSDAFLRQFVTEFYLRRKNVIVITGHTDDVGSYEYNKKLSLQRAGSVKQKLISFGIAGDQIQVKGMGEQQPLVSNDTESGRARNRRVEITFY